MPGKQYVRRMTLANGLGLWDLMLLQVSDFGIAR